MDVRCASWDEVAHHTQIHSPTMLFSSRSRVPVLMRPCRRPFAPRTYTSDNPLPANDPNPKAPPQNVSETNAVPTSAEGSGDITLQEMPAEAEEKRVMQAPNRQGIWSRSQQPREKAMVGPRFEQTIMEDQVRHAHSTGYMYLPGLIRSVTDGDPATAICGH